MHIIEGFECVSICTTQVGSAEHQESSVSEQQRFLYHLSSFLGLMAHTIIIKLYNEAGHQQMAQNS